MTCIRRQGRISQIIKRTNPPSMGTKGNVYNRGRVPVEKQTKKETWEETVWAA